MQVVANILNNAARYTPEGGELRLRTDVRESQLVIEIIDNGVGMAPESTTRAFDLFGYGRERDRDQALAVGFDPHLVKPADMKIRYSILAGAGRD